MNNSSTRTEIIQRLKRIEGQVRGVQKMLEEDRPCNEIAQQLQAAKSGIQSANKNLIQHYLSDCLKNNQLPEEQAKEMSKLFSYLD